ncbi:STAS domain-containing protein [Streptomyces cyanogenus]|uniref:Anti-sigma-B factor antagonist n=1 Tax=Streptomyces cyanogenus TaxID=80860 RepID=A0ABX7TWE2_STRCY|nr:STAS domain-containing protein [Streptomyces cyanogenus]QTD99555.1 Anti-sigma-B factor antagonist [Streptomyces cyanogenus]
MSWDEAIMPRLTSDAGGTRWPDQAGGRAPEASVTQYERGDAWVVAAHGSYDMHSIPPLTDALDAAAKEHPLVVLDASGVVFADSAFLNLLILTHQTGTLRVAAPTRQLRRLFEITGVDTVLDVRETVDEAAAC